MTDSINSPAAVIRFAAVIGKVIRMTRAMCARDSAPTAATPCADCSADIAALRALAKRLEQLTKANAFIPRSQDEAISKLQDLETFVALLAAGYTPEEEGK